MVESGDVDVLIVGAGVLGVTIAFWLSLMYDCKIALADQAASAAHHTTSRNTGVVHRPYYLHPTKKRMFARTSLVSHRLWQNLAQSAGLPWKRVGTYNVAVDDEEIDTIEEYLRWGAQNGMEEGELELFDGTQVRSQEPEVACKAALLSREDVSTDFGALTRHIWRSLLSRGVAFLGGRRASSFRRSHDGIEVHLRGRGSYSTLNCRLLINAAGGGALEMAQRFGFGGDLAMLSFRGEYWEVDEPLASRVTSNIYRPPRFQGYPFLDPHFVVRSNGKRQIGPNAVLVTGPYVYRGVGLGMLPSFLDRPTGPKLSLLRNPEFLSLLSAEWMSSVSKRSLCDRVRKFVPSLRTDMLRMRGVSGVRSSVVDGHGFVPEPVLFRGEDSVHVVNFNSPGATGAPAYSAMVLEHLRNAGLFEGFAKRSGTPTFPGWDFESVVGRVRG